MHSLERHTIRLLRSRVGTRRGDGRRGVCVVQRTKGVSSLPRLQPARKQPVLLAGDRAGGRGRWCGHDLGRATGAIVVGRQSRGLQLLSVRDQCRARASCTNRY